MRRWIKHHKNHLLLGLASAVIGAAVAVVFGLFIKTEPPSVTTLTPPPQAPQLKPPVIELAKYAEGFKQPVVITATPDTRDQRIFVVQQEGTIKIVQADGTVTGQPFLDIRSKVQNDREMGLLGLAFSPNYASDGNIFVNYVDKQQNTIIARYHAALENTADPASEKVILKIAQPYPNHNGGDLVFGPDGYLYIALGDGGSGGDPQDRAQDMTTLLGKMLRLDVSQIPYKVPASNPFSGQSGKKPEIWSYGLRNPWRFSFDRQTKDMYIADVGEGEIEEINFEPAGSKGGINYGWRCFEGSRDFNLEGCGARTNYVFPILEYDHAEDRCSVTGGYVYRGKSYPALDGKYIYGDFCGGQLYSAQKDGNKWQATLITRSPHKISTFGEDSTGELYLADYATGGIYQIRDTAN